jgi:hypothetical protein
VDCVLIIDVVSSPARTLLFGLDGKPIDNDAGGTCMENCLRRTREP